MSADWPAAGARPRRPRTATHSLPSGAAARRGGPLAGVAPLLVLQAWVWVASAVSKLISPQFVQGFSGFVAQGITADKPAVYDDFLQRVILGAPGLFAFASIVTELLLGTVFTVTAIALLTGRNGALRPLLTAAMMASAVGAVFAVNLALLAGDAAPWQVGSPFDSGVPVEYLLAGLSVAGAVAALGARRRLSASHLG